MSRDRSSSSQKLLESWCLWVMELRITRSAAQRIVGKTVEDG